MSTNPYSGIERGEPGTIGWKVHYFETLPSTQDRAADLARKGAAQGTVVIAEEQTAGRGRLGRQWHSPPAANLYATIILRPAIPISEIPRLSLVAGVAVADAMDATAGGIAGLKWPNDVWLRRKKVGGILAQALIESAETNPIVLLGIGINVNLRSEQIPEELRDRATSLLAETGAECDRRALAAKLFARLDMRYRQAQTSGFAALRAEWERYSVLSGRRVSVQDGVSVHYGVVRGIEADGALVLENAGTLTRIVVGDVTVEGAYD